MLRPGERIETGCMSERADFLLDLPLLRPGERIETLIRPGERIETAKDIVAIWLPFDLPLLRPGERIETALMNRLNALIANGRISPLASAGGAD